MSRTYKNFSIEAERKVPELPCTLVECTHTPSGAKIVHIASDDPENFFCLSFKTLPTSSNGVAHVLEHLVLCGSERFPVKDPFFAMTRRSMQTFMNAFTGTDFTCYPAASQIEKDFYNLLDVYIDSVFFPKLTDIGFLQEGSRLEYNETNDLVINGVVYNEMKGSFSNPIRRLLQETATKIFPDSPYGYNSGGDPKEIRQLSLNDVRAFHAMHYHPSRCLFFFYGNIPLEKHLDFLEEKILRATKPPCTDHLANPSPQPHFLAPKKYTTEYPVSPDELAHAPSFIAFSWLTTTLPNQRECLALSLLESMLFGTDASPIKSELLHTKKCKQVSSFCDSDLFDVPFTIVLSGCQAIDTKEVQEVLLQALSKVAEEGLSQTYIETALHELELAKTEINGEGAPFGLSLFWRCAPLIQHSIDPMKGLTIRSLFEELRSTLAGNPRFFSSLIQKYFLENTHLVTLTMTPSATKEEEELSEEREFLHSVSTTLSAKEKEEIIARKNALTQSQEEIQDLSCLPTITLKDVPLTCRKIHLHHETISSVDLFSDTPFTNGLCYVSIVTPIPYIPEEDLWLLHLFSMLLTQLGCGNRSYRDTLEYIQAYTGGVYASISITPQATHAHEVTPTCVLRGKCLNRNIERFFSILSDFILSPRLDERERVKEIIEKHGTDLQNSLQSRALDYAGSKACASLSPAQAISEYLYGVTYYQKVQSLIASYDAQEAWLLEKLRAISDTVLNTQGMHIVYCGDADTLAQIKENNLYGLAEVSGKPSQPWVSPSIEQEDHDTIYCIPEKVSFTATALPTVSFSHRDAPKLSLLSALMNNTFLHKYLREQGGAYGGGSSAQVTTGSFSFYSYRDPNLFSTLQTYKASLSWIEQGSFDEGNITEAKLSVLQDLDSPIAPGGRAEVGYFWWRQGKSEEMRQRFKDLVRETTKEEIQALIHSYFQNKLDKRPFVAFTSQEILKKNMQKFVDTGRKVLKKKL